MSKDELQKNFKIRTVRRRTTGTITVFSFPQDIIDNTRRAYNTDPASATGYGGDGPPTGRYIAPASGSELHRALRGRLRRAAPGAAARPDVLALGHAPEQALPVRRRRRRSSSAIEVLNVFDNINFNHQRDARAAATTPSG